ncbi:MAG: hypothetical protein RBT57_04965 [Paludibacter sp.]|nr:hypothetical protein [Paludibacter sp.]
MIRITFLLLMAFALVACNPQPDIDDATMLDGTQINDLSLYKPEKYLVSAAIPNPTEQQKNTPVLIAAHGYSATTFEWDELREYADSKGTFLVSQVLLGGHGRDFADFKAASWRDWQSSIRDEYKRLRTAGFKHISLAGSSTGAPLIVELFTQDFFKTHGAPDEVFLIDPIVVSGNKTLVLVGLLGPVLGYTTTDLDEGEKGKWYVYRPQESLKQLMELIDLTRRNLEKGITLTPGTNLTIFKSEIDRTADPVSAVLLHKGFHKAHGQQVDVQMISSELHVFTRLRGRNTVTDKDRTNQQNAFIKMEESVIND